MGTRLQYFCDVHEIKGEDAIAEPDLPMLGFNGKWYKFFWCKPCFHETPFTVLDLQAMIEEHGLEISADEIDPKAPGSHGRGGKADAGKDAQCLWCPQATTIGNLNIHIKKHGFKGFGEAFGRVCPMCNEESGILGQHAKVHNADNVAHLFQVAKKAGDPHGIVKERQKAAA